MNQEREKERKRKKEAEKLLRKEAQNKLNTERSLKKAKTLPALKDVNGNYETQSWYHIGMGQHERIKYLKTLYKRFDSILNKQRAYKRNPSKEWVDFPAELIDTLCLYEGSPSNELILLRL
jgi:hypothetical protein